MKIYHNPRCRKSRETLALIQAAGIEPEIVEYLKTPPTARELSDLVDKLGLEPQELFRTGETEYKELKLSGRKLSRQEALQILAEHPKLLQRPIVVQGNRAILGRPPENVQKLL